MTKKRNFAWHFVGDTLRDGRPVPPDGEWLLHPGKLILCEKGLHWSRQPFDALNYAPGPILCLVEVGGTIHEPKGVDKGISSQRKIVARIDATELMRYFARMQALSVTHLWADADDPNDTVLEYLLTGENRAAARAAAWDAAWDSARAAVWAAARAAARDAARDAAWDSARQHFNDLVFESFSDYL